MTATGPFATAGTDSKPDRRSLLGHGPATLVRGRLLLASLAATPRLREDAVRYYLADDFAHWLEHVPDRPPRPPVDDGA